MKKQVKRILSAILVAVFALSVFTFTPVMASAKEITITLEDLQKQQPNLFTKFEYVPGYPIFGLTSEYTIPKGMTLVISNKETPLQISNIDNSKFGALIVSEGATLLVEPEGSISINSPEGIKIEKGGIIKFANDATREFARTTYLNDIVNNGTIIAGEKRQVAQNGRFSGNRPIGSFHLYDMSWQYSERGALEYFEDFAPEKQSDMTYYVPDVFPTVGYSGYSGLPIYWSVKETPNGYIYMAELIPLYEYDGFWVFEKGGKEIDYSKPIQIKGGVLKFGVSSELTVVTCTYNIVKERVSKIDELIKSQGKRPVVGSIIVSIPEQTPTPTITLTPQTVTPTASTVYINGKATAFEAYNINGNNFFKLRDLAMVLNGTQKQFDVGYNNDTKAITMTCNKPYTITGGELSQGDGKEKTANPTESRIYLDGKELSLTVYNINGNNFFKLRDLMKAIDVYVGYDNNTRAITVDTSKGYVE